MIRLRAADESSLSDDAIKLIIKTAIRLAHLLESIFHLLKINSQIRDKQIGTRQSSPYAGILPPLLFLSVTSRRSGG
jgi:hypothetical protein